MDRGREGWRNGWGGGGGGWKYVYNITAVLMHVYMHDACTCSVHCYVLLTHTFTMSFYGTVE